MYSGLLHAHSGLRWLALILLLAAVFVSMQKRSGQAGYTDGDRKLYLFSLISVHTQLLIGLVLFFISPKVDFSMMSDKIYRFYTAEHSVGMLIAIALITVGYSKHKRLSGSAAKHKAVFTFYAIGLIVILASIPWPFRIPGAGWF